MYERMITFQLSYAISKSLQSKCTYGPTYLIIFYNIKHLHIYTISIYIYILLYILYYTIYICTHTYIYICMYIIYVHNVIQKI